MAKVFHFRGHFFSLFQIENVCCFKFFYNIRNEFRLLFLLVGLVTIVFALSLLPFFLFPVPSFLSYAESSLERGANGALAPPSEFRGQKREQKKKQTSHDYFPLGFENLTTALICMQSPVSCSFVHSLTNHYYSLFALFIKRKSQSMLGCYLAPS